MLGCRYHATEVEPHLQDHKDMAGGTENGPINTAPTWSEKQDTVLGESHEHEGSSSFNTDEEPTEEERVTLRRVADKLPWSAWLVAIVELCERFAYYGLSGPFQNYMQNKYQQGKVPGAIGLGQASATGLSNFFQFWCYVTPIIGYDHLPNYKCS
jgi:POT family proton-dependent oligopeptide transporter